MSIWVIDITFNRICAFLSRDFRIHEKGKDHRFQQMFKDLGVRQALGLCASSRFCPKMRERGRGGERERVCV